MAAREPVPPRLRWRCRRGTRELDLLLARWLEQDWPRADRARRRAFAELLEQADPDLADWLIGGVRPPDAERAALVDAIVRGRR